MPMSASVVCNNILTRAFQENIPVSPMKLQKLMYFVSCEYVKATGKDLLSENFGVWQYGPVLPSLYDEFKSFHDQPITKYATDADGVPYAINEDTAPHLKASITRVWDAFKGMDGIALSKITHRDGSAWSTAFNQQRTSISSDDMKGDMTYASYLLT